MTIGMELGLGTDHIVLDGDTARLSKGTQPPIFNPFLLRPNCWMHQDAIWYGSRPRPRPHCIRWEPSSPPQRRRRSPQFSASVYCGQTAGRIKMPLGTVVNLVRDDIVQHGVAAPPKRGTAPSPVFGPCLSWPNGWMVKGATWYGSDFNYVFTVPVSDFVADILTVSSSSLI